MNNPLLNAFFLGRAFAEAVSEQVSNAVSVSLSELGKFDAEQRERLREFTEQVVARANQEAEAAMRDRPVTTETTVGGGEDLQALLDNLRAEVAQLRTELQRYRNRSQN